MAAVGLVLLSTACAQAPAASDQKPVSQATSSPAASPIPSPSPSPVTPLTISAAPFHPGEIAFGYAQVSPTAAGGVPPYTWEISEGALPAGLSMTPAGQVTGTPANLGSFLFTLRVADSSGATATFSSSISISKRLVVTGTPCTPRSPCAVEAGCVTVCGTFAFQTSGIGPFKYAVTSGALPTGMGLNGLSLTRAFPAPPAGVAAKDWIFTVRITDAIGATAQTTAQFHVFPHIAFTGATTTTCTGTATACIFATPLTYAYGTPGLVQATASATGLPKGFGVIVQGTAVTGITCGSNTAPVVFKGAVSIVLVDKSTCAASQYCTSGPANVTVDLTC